MAESEEARARFEYLQTLPIGDPRRGLAYDRWRAAQEAAPEVSVA